MQYEENKTLRRPGERRDPYAAAIIVAEGVCHSTQPIGRGVWIPARAEPVIGPAEGRTRWLGRDDSTEEQHTKKAPVETGA